MSARLLRIKAFRLTTAEPQALLAFYAALGFEIDEQVAISAEEMHRLGLEGRGVRIALSRAGSRLELESFEPAGRPYPRQANAADLCFQHFALPTTEMAAAWEQARAHGAEPISADGPVQLPAASGGAVAVKFRDPEGHPLELLQWPGTARLPRNTPAFGIDHSAISVADVIASQNFYRALGLEPDPGTINHGPTQAALDALAGVIVDVLPLRAAQRDPHVELLGYRHPRGRPAEPLRVNDVAATRIVWAADADAILRDPDGHLHLLERQPGA
ncbi:MAG TPA: VOC family protein [Steroidobacteraceae bacterium]|nr:VOC family protein [Steroidobacteraceae bacterium]